MKHRKTNYTFLLPLIALVFAFSFQGCKDDFEPEESFIKVYDDQVLQNNYFPLSMHRTSDNGYLFLSAKNGSGIHILKADALGEMSWEYDLPSNFVNAVPNIIERNGSLHFVCMDAVGLFTYVMQVDEAAQSASAIQTFPTIPYPLYVYDSGNSIYLQTYERESYKTGVYALNDALDQIVDSGLVDIQVDVEAEIVDHINYTGKRFPFFVSKTPEDDYVVINGFNNYSFSGVFLDANLDVAGVYSGAAFDGGLSAMLPLGGNQFSLARFSYDDIYINPAADLSPSAVDIAESIPADWNAELDADSPILIKQMDVKGTNYSVYLATTKSNQLVLSFYAAGSSEVVANKYIGQSIPLKASDFMKTEDGGMMILTQATVMSSFNRVATIKLSKEELEGLFE